MLGRDELGRIDWSRAVVLSPGCASGSPGGADVWAVPPQILIQFVWVEPGHVCFL